MPSSISWGTIGPSFGSTVASGAARWSRKDWKGRSKQAFILPRVHMELDAVARDVVLASIRTACRRLVGQVAELSTCAAGHLFAGRYLDGTASSSTMLAGSKSWSDLCSARAADRRARAARDDTTASVRQAAARR